MTEWRPVVGWEDMYDVSDEGDVRRTAPSTRPTKRGGGLLAPRASTSSRDLIRKPYPKVALNRGKVREDVPIHQLVAAAFLGPRPEGTEINHRDGNPYNNHVGNLEYITHAENVAHGWHARLRRKGTRITREDAALIRRTATVSNRGDLARRFGISSGAVRDIANGRLWRTL